MENKTILNIILISILVIYVLFFTYLMIRYVIPRHRSDSKPKEEVKPENVEISLCNNNQTEFYKKSVQYAEKILFGKAFESQYGEENYYGNKLITLVNKLNEETKKAIVITIQYFSVEPTKARETEQLFRMMSEQEKVPLWFIILRESTKKVVPEFSFSSTPSNDDQITNIIPLYKSA